MAEAMMAAHRYTTKPLNISVLSLAPARRGRGVSHLSQLVYLLNHGFVGCQVGALKCHMFDDSVNGAPPRWLAGWGEILASSLN